MLPSERFARALTNEYVAHAVAITVVCFVTFDGWFKHVIFQEQTFI
jgi:hypothetical protein